MSVVPFRAEHAASLGQSLVPDIAARLQKNKYAITVLAGEKVLLCAGAYEVWNGRFMSWTFVDHDKARGHWLTIHKAVRNLVSLVCEEARRLEANVLCDFEAGHRWVRHLGFTLETPCMPKFSPDGQDAAMYVIVKE